MNDRFRFRVWDNEFKKYRTGLGINNGLVCTYNDATCALEQCTGLRDKNGKLIFEEDLIRTNGNYAEGIYIVKRDDEALEYDLLDKDKHFIYQLTKGMEFIEVIGNIHENKDLLV